MRSMLAPAGARFLHVAPRTAGLPPPLAALVQCACALLAALAAARARLHDPVPPAAVHMPAHRARAAAARRGRAPRPRRVPPHAVARARAGASVRAAAL